MANETAIAILKPCPFCGSEKVFLNVMPPHTHIFANMPISLGSATVECLNCEATLIRDTEEEVVKAWNRRANNGA